MREGGREGAVFSQSVVKREVRRREKEARGRDEHNLFVTYLLFHKTSLTYARITIIIN